MTDTVTKAHPHQLALSVGLRDDATLSNFYPGDNALAVVAVRAAAEGGDEHFVFVWGPSGSGGTHLLQAACHAAAAVGRQSLYLPLDQVVAYGPQVLEGLESLELVCLDHLHAVAGDADWEEGLFHLFNRLRDAGCALLVAADAPPRRLRIRLPDLASRLSWGLVFQLHGLDDAGKVQALQLRAHARGIQLSEEAALYILHRSPRQMSALFALLERLDSASLSAKRRVTIPFIKETLGW
ncbi:DnaA regulatory inactivator Hda [Motiliproteus sp. SC1-56]|uniref:DnaA regulatory inactivator Hda n=1 Tax=Motiliproteus sp. SC1-56 TaxID=2799565 RepID=UPI001A8DF135|nr:DnaA regulatory inactivator Hda [Motiliproteus sp. SC1-56]